MTEPKEVEQTCKDEIELVNNDPAATKETEIVKKNHMEDEKEVGEEKEEGETDEDDDEDEETEESEGDDDLQEHKSEPSLVHASNDGRKELHVEEFRKKTFDKNIDSSVVAVENGEALQTVNVYSNVDDVDPGVPVETVKSGLVLARKSPVSDEMASVRSDAEEDSAVKLDVCDSLSHQSIDDETISRKYTKASPNARFSPSKVEHANEEEFKDDVKLKEISTDLERRTSTKLLIFDTDTSGVGDSGTAEEQAAFMMELHKFNKDRSMDFRPPKFYGEPLNLLKLWRAVLKLGGYDKVTACKYWRQVGESFKPPKTCTTISFTFRTFYEKALLDYERYRTSADGSGLLVSLAVPMGAESQAPGSGRTRRDAAARAMQGWHSQRILDNGEVSNPITKDKNSTPVSKKEKALKTLGGILKRRKPSSPDDAIKSAHVKLPKLHSDATVIDIGSPADWVKINVRATRDCYEVYALVPGLLREEVRVQSDPAGRLVISGEPENPDNPWNVTPFKKVVSLPSRIDPHQTSAVVTLHGQLFVRVPFEQYD